MSSNIEKRLAEIGVTLPPPGAPGGNYVPFVVVGDLVFMAGQVAREAGKMKYVGKVGRDVSVEDGRAAARLCAVNLIAQLKAACGGDLDKVDRCVRVGGFVNSPSDFTDHPKVINGASDILAEVFGERGQQRSPRSRPARRRLRARVKHLQPRADAVMRFGLFARKDRTREPARRQPRISRFTSTDEADRLGFESVFFEHPYRVGQLSASLNLLSYVAAATKRIRLGTAVVVLPWHNPALLAEQVGTLDVLSGGRVDLGIGRGYRKVEFEQFCIPMREAQERFDECLAFLLKAWNTEGRFTHESRHWKYKDIVVEPAPRQRPHPPIWMAGGSPESITRVANMNFNLLVDQVGSLALTFERLGVYLDTLEQRGLPRDAGRVGVARGLHVVHNEAERAQALERRRATIRNIGELARRPGSTEELVDDGALLGTPAEIIDKLHRLAEGGVEYVLLTNAVATPEALREFAEEILPHAPRSGTTSLQSVTTVAGTA